ncbi:MAG TPA: methyltransferase domain-containing protein [Bryobacteraceae bacterium]|nr:methyltransferase domain-containing protein [Bryobacteraceae bacterium]
MFKAKFRKLVQPLVPGFVMRWVDPFHTVLLEHLTAAARKLPPGSMVLDAGAGECPHAPLFAHTHYVRLDRGIGDKAWDYSKIEVLGDISELPFREGSFDAVINIQVLEHLKEPAIGIGEMARVLKPGGELILTTVQCWEIHQHPNDFFRYTRYGLTYLFDKAGLESRVEALGGLFWLIGFRLMAILSFFQKSWRWIIFAVLLPIFGFAIPVICYFLDPVDRRRDYTLGYFCWCRKL